MAAVEREWCGVPVVLIVEDHAIVRRGLRQILEEDGGLHIYEAGTAAEAERTILEREFDIALVDLSLPDGNGLELLKRIHVHRPRLPILVLSIHPEEQFAIRAIKAGAAGYVTKDAAPEALLGALHKVLGGGRYVSHRLAERMVEAISNPEGLALHEKLSDRELQVLMRIAGGRTVSEIADELHLSVKTVSTYRARILEKMGLRTNAELTYYAISNGLVTPT